MNKKIIIALAAASFLGGATSSQAGGYSSSQTPATNDGYSSSQTAATNSGYTTTQTGNTSRTVFEKHNKHFSISVNLPAAAPTTQTYTVNYKVPRNHHVPHWVNTSYGKLPKHAVAGGYEANGTPLYICQARYHGGMHPGKVVGDNCNFSYGGAEIMTPTYQVLAMHNGYNWIATSNGFVPANAISGGYENGHALYICQAQYQGGLHPGKVVGNNCNFSYAGNEVSTESYNVLVG